DTGSFHAIIASERAITVNTNFIHASKCIVRPPVHSPVNRVCATTPQVVRGGATRLWHDILNRVGWRTCRALQQGRAQGPVRFLREAAILYNTSQARPP